MKKSARFLSLLLLCAMLMSFMSFGAEAEEETTEPWDGSVATEFAGGAGTADDPYQIANAAQLAYLASLVNGGNPCEGEFFLLTADIDLGGSASPWTPIGKADSTPFKGVFMGNGKTVSNLCTVQNVARVGLFGYVENGELCDLTLDSITAKVATANADGGALVGAIKNTSICSVHVKNTDISTTRAAGGVVGAAVGGEGIVNSITGCSFADGTVICTTNSSVVGAGGILGFLRTGPGSTEVSGCSCTSSAPGTVTVQAANYPGGIVGSQYSGASQRLKIYDCYNNAFVLATAGSSDAGGIIGYGSGNTSSVERCYNAGNVKGLGSASGITGYPTGAFNMIACFNLGTLVQGSSTRYAIMKNSGTSGRPRFCGCVKTTNVNCSGSIEYDNEASLLEVMNHYFADSGTWTTADGVRPTLNAVHKVGCHCRDASSFAVNPGFEGSGTIEDPYLIGSVADFQRLSMRVCTGDIDTAGKYFELTEDVDFARSVKEDTVISYEMFPIGETSANPFKGVFMGKGHTIRHLNINSDHTNSYAFGLFGQVEGGEICDLKLEDSTINVLSTSNNTGAVAGTITNGARICNVHVKNVTVKGAMSGVGGIVGGAATGATNGDVNTITGCSFEGGWIIGPNSNTSYGTGGILGRATGANNSTRWTEVSGCWSNTTIGGNIAGGIVGNQATNLSGSTPSGAMQVRIFDCCNKSTVGAVTIGGVSVSPPLYAGGIAGYLNSSSCKVDRCYNTGAVNAFSNSGYAAGIVGYGLSITITSSYNTGTVTGKYITAISRNTQDSYGRVSYPTANYCGCIVKNGESVGANVTAYETEAKLIGAMNLFFAHTYAWDTSADKLPELRQTHIVIGGEKACHCDGTAPASTPDFEGEGTADAPYLIRCVADFQRLAVLVDVEGYDSANKYFLLTNDVSFSDQAMIPIGTDATHAFKGVFMGGGKTVSDLSILSSTGDVGLFGYVDSGELCNLHIKDSEFKSTSTSSSMGNVGSAAARIVGNTKICNIHAANVTVEGTKGVGGIIGDVDTKNDSVATVTSITGCSFVNGTVKLTQTDNYQKAAGGILGTITGYQKYTKITEISGCRCEDSAVTGYVAGGIIGNQGTYNSTAAGYVQKVNISDCYNSSSVSSVAATSSRSSYAGGIAGIAISYGSVERCCNVGTISIAAGSSATYAGGIAGYCNLPISYCYNAGTVDANASSKAAISAFGENANNTKNCGCFVKNGETAAGYITKYDTEDALIAAIKTAFAEIPAWNTAGSGYPKLNTVHHKDAQGVQDCHCDTVYHEEAPAPVAPAAEDFASLNDAVNFVGTDATSAIVGGYTVGDVTGDAETGYYCVVTLNDPTLYTLSGYTVGEFAENTVTLRYNGSAWVVDSAAELTVTPDASALTSLDSAVVFGDTGATSAITGDYTIGTLNADGTCVVTLNDTEGYALDGYTIGEFAEDKNTVTFKLEDGEWVVVTPARLKVTPVAPAAAKIADIADAVKFAGTDETSKIISKLDEENKEIGYSVGDVTETDGKFFCEVTLNDASLYALDGYTTDGFAEGKDKVVLEYKNGEWTLAENGAAQIAVTKILTVSFNVGSHTNAVFAPVASMQPVNGKVTLPAAPVNSGSWVYVFRGWSDDNGATWMKPGTEYSVTADIELKAVWRLASLTGDESWNFRDAMSIMDHIDNSKAFVFCPEQLAIANFDLDKRGTINYRDAMAIMSWADHSLTVFPFPDDSPAKP